MKKRDLRKLALGNFLFVSVLLYLLYHFSVWRCTNTSDSSRTLIRPQRVNDDDVRVNSTPAAAVCGPAGAGVFSLVALKPTVLHSISGCGSTWLRHLLTTASGILTGAVYNTEIDVYAVGRKSRRVVAVKSHKGPKDTRQLFPVERILFLVRDPYESMLSEFNREGNYESPDPFYVKTALRSPREFETEWPAYVDRRSRSFAERYVQWTKDPAPAYVVLYHRLRANLQQELQKIFSFLNESSIPLKIHCAVQDSEGSSHRKKADWQQEAAVLTASQKETMNANIDKLQAALEAKTGEKFDDFQTWKR